ncbi:MAG: type II toxin-antitoxin system RelB/DinJ family antitoxin [Parcubacteria group bacterium]|nr:type II toxin-antitoxin system RelB/DinJ family antitoxin [Parcubacteria group bacterium]
MKTVINIKADREVKKNAQKIAEDMGFSLSALINAYLRQFIRNRAVYFSSLPKMSPELEKLLGKVEVDARHKKNISRPLTSLEEVINYLDTL